MTESEAPLFTEEEFSHLLEDRDELLKVVESRFQSRLSSVLERNQDELEAQSRLAESRAVLLEKRLKLIEESHRSALTKSSSSTSEVQTQLSASQQALSELQQRFRQSEEQLRLKQEEVSSWTRRVEELNGEKLALVQVLTKRDSENSSLSDRVTDLETRLDSKKKDLFDLNEKLSESQLETLPLRNQVELLLQQNRSSQTTIEWFETQLKNKVEETDESIKRLGEARTRSVRDLSEEREKSKVYQEKIKRQAVRIARLEVRGQELRDENERAKVADLDRMLDIQKKYAENQRSLDQVSEERSKLRKRLQRLLGANHDQKEKYELAAREQAEEMDALQRELANAQDDLRRLKREAAGGQDVIEPTQLTRSLSINDVYTRYVDARERLLEREKELHSTRSTLQLLQREVEEKAPLFEKQRDDYEKTAAAQVFLTKKFNELRSEYETAFMSLRDVKTKNADLERSNLSLRKENDDLSNQIANLLRESESGLDSKPLLLVDADSDEVSSSDVVISERLVVFGDIVELQKKNRDLLRALRALSSQQENDARITREELQAEYTAKVDKLVLRANELKERYDVAQDNVAKLVHEKKVLLRLTRELQERDGDLEHENEIHTLESDFDKERSLLREEATSQRHLRLRQEGDLLRATSECAEMKQRIENLVQTSEDAKRLLEYERNRSSNYSNSVLELEKVLTTTRSSLTTAVDSLSRTKNELDAVKVELQYSRERTDSLTRQVGEMKTLKGSVDRLYEDLQREHVILRKLASDERLSYKEELDELRFEKSQLKKNLDKHQTMLEATRQNLEEKEEELKRVVAQHEGELRSVREENLSLEMAKRALAEKCESMSGKMSVHQRNLTDAVQRSLLSSEGDSSDELEVQAGRDKIRLLELSLEKERDVATQANKSLRLQQRECTSLYAAIEKLRTELSSAEQRSETLKATLGERSKLIQTLKLELEKANSSHQQSERNLTDGSESWQRRIDILQSDLQSQRNELDSTNRRYEEEILAHGKKIEEVEVLKADVSRLREENSGLKKVRETLEQSLQQHERSWGSAEDSLKKQVEEMTTHLSNLRKQNELLHRQIELSVPDVPGDGVETLASSPDESLEAIANLKGVVSFLRKEQDVLNSRMMLVEQKKERAENMYEFARKKIVNLEQRLVEARKAVPAPESEREYADSMALLNQVNVYKENNDMLRKQLKEVEGIISEKDVALQEIRNRLGLAERDAALAKKQKTMVALEKQTIQEHNDRLKQRIQELYKKQDPENERDRLREEVASQTEEITRLRGIEDTYGRLKSNQRKLVTRYKEYRSLLENLREQKATLEEEKASLVTEKEQIGARLVASQKTVETLSQQVEGDVIREEHERLKKQLSTLSERFQAEMTELRKKLADAESSGNEQAALVTPLRLQLRKYKILARKQKNSIESLQEEMENSREQLNSTRGELTRARRRLKKLRRSTPPPDEEFDERDAEPADDDGFDDGLELPDADGGSVFLPEDEEDEEEDEEEDLEPEPELEPEPTAEEEEVDLPQSNQEIAEEALDAAAAVVAEQSVDASDDIETEGSGEVENDEEDEGEQDDAIEVDEDDEGSPSLLRKRKIGEVLGSKPVESPAKRQRVSGSSDGLALSREDSEDAEVANDDADSASASPVLTERAERARRRLRLKRPKLE